MAWLEAIKVRWHAMESAVTLPLQVDYDPRDDGADQVVSTAGLTVAFMPTPKERYENVAEFFAHAPADIARLIAEVERLAAGRTPAPEHCRVERFPLSEEFKQDIASNIDIGRGAGRTPAPEPDEPQESAERTLKSLATMLGWGNVPPRETLEREIAALKSLAVPSPAEARELEKP